MIGRRFGRAAAWVAAAGLWATPAPALVVTSVTVQSPAYGPTLAPGTAIPVGATFSLTLTLVNDTGLLADLCTSDDPATLFPPSCYSYGIQPPYGAWWVYPNLGVCPLYAPANAASPIGSPSGAFVPFTFTPGETATVTWAYQAVAPSPGVDFSVVAHVEDYTTGFYYYADEGSGDPCGAAGGDGTLANILSAKWGAKLVIGTAPAISVTAFEASAGTRPAGTAFLEDHLRTEAMICNPGSGSLTINVVTGQPVMGGGAAPLPSGAPLAPTTGPALPVTLPAGGCAFFTWTWSVAGDASCGVAPGHGPGPATGGAGTAAMTVAADAFTGGSNVLAVVPAPYTVTATRWIDPDGPGPLPAMPLGPLDRLYYMTAERLELRATVHNTGSDTFDLAMGDWTAQILGATPEYHAVSAPSAIVGFAPGATQSLTWVFEVDPAGPFGAGCNASGYGYDFTLAGRGVCDTESLRVDAVPFDPSGGAPTTDFTIAVPGVATTCAPFTVPVTMHNRANRPIVLAAGATAAFNFPPPGVITSVPPSSPPPPYAIGAGSTTTVLCQLQATAPGSQQVDGGLAWGGLFPCLHACANPGSCSPPPSVLVGACSPLHASLAATGGPFSTGQNVPFTLTLDNTDPACAFTVDSPCFQPSVIGSATGPTGVTPVFPVVVPPLTSKTVAMTWAGSICVPSDSFGSFPPCGGASIQVTSSCGGPPVGVAVSSPAVEFRQAAAPACAVAVSQNQVASGLPVTIWLTMTNDGSADVNALTVGLAPAAGSAPGTLTGPSPAAPATLAGAPSCVALPNGAAATLAWTWVPSGPGTAVFHATASGSDALSAAPVSTACDSPVVTVASPSSLAGLVTAPAAVSLTVSCVGCSPVSVQPISVVMAVRNTGQGSAVNMAPTAGTVLPCSGPGCGGPTGTAAVLAPPSPATATIPGGGTVSFTWTYKPTGAGCVRLQTSVAGTDLATSQPRAVVANSGCIQIDADLPVEARLVSAPARITAGQTFPVVVELHNPAAVPVQIVGGDPALTFLSPVSGAVLNGSYAAALPAGIVLQPGETLDVTINVTALPSTASGPVRIAVPATSASYAAVDPATGAPVYVLDVGSPLAFEVLPAGFGLGPLGPNPFHPALGSATIGYRLAGSGSARLTLYTIAGDLVHKLATGTQDPGYHEVVWDGRNDDGQPVASGVYLVRLSAGSDAVTAKLAVIR